MPQNCPRLTHSGDCVGIDSELTNFLSRPPKRCKHTTHTGTHTTHNSQRRLRGRRLRAHKLLEQAAEAVGLGVEEARVLLQVAELLGGLVQDRAQLIERQRAALIRWRTLARNRE